MANSRDFPVIPCSVSLHLIRETRGDRVIAGFSLVRGLKRALKNRKFPVNSLVSANSAEQGSPMTASTASNKKGPPKGALFYYQCEVPR
jgi:hypothetical protein